MANQFFLISLVTMALFFTSLLHVESRNGEFLFVSLDSSNHMVKTHDNSSPLESPTPAPAPVAGGENNNIDEFAPVPAAPETGNVFAPSPIESGNGFFGFAPVQAPTPAPSRGDDIEIAPTPSVSGIVNAAPAPAPESFETDNPYGLYGQEVEEDKKELNNEKLPATEYNNNNGYDNNNYNRNTGGYSNTAYSSMGYSNRAYNSMGYSNEKQGMSDTRFLDNGKYYYGPKPGNYNEQNDGERYESVRESSNEEGYYGKLSQSDLQSMEEYERQNGYSP